MAEGYQSTDTCLGLNSQSMLSIVVVEDTYGRVRGQSLQIDDPLHTQENGG
jgi:hypothetical protein